MTGQGMRVTDRGEVLPAPGFDVHAPVRIIGLPHALRGDEVQMDVPAGLTVAQIVAMVIAEPAQQAHAIVLINGHIIGPENRHRIRPKPGMQVMVKAWVGKEYLGAVLSIVLTIVAPYIAGTLLGLTAGTVGYSLAVAGVTLVGSMLINALVAPPTQNDPVSPKTRLGLQGSRNSARPYAAIPMVLGRHLITPPLGAEAYTEFEGNDAYLRQVFIVGYGPLEISQIKIGETPIDDFRDVEYEVREGYAGDNDLTLFPDVAFQDGLSIELIRSEGWSQRTSAADVDEIFVDVEWPQGLGQITKKGNENPLTRTVQIEYRKSGDAAWIAVPDVKVTSRVLKTIRRSRRIKVPRAQYEVRLRAGEFKVNSDDFNDFDTVVWTGLRGFRNQDPIKLGKPLARIAVRIRATNQLNGVIDQLNCVATSVAKRWNGTAWVNGTTRNPAALYRHILQGPFLKKPFADSRLELPDLQYWSERCTALSLECDAVISDQESLFDLLRMVAGTGRAAFGMRDSKYSITLDEPQTVPRQMFTPRNIIGMTAERAYPDLPDALRVRFVSRRAGYQADEVIVYNEGKSQATAQTFDDLDLWGVTSEDQAVAAGWYHFTAAKLRPETLEIQTDVEGLVVRPGHMVRVAHDALLTGLAQGRIVARTLDGGGNLTGLRVDELCPMVTGTAYAIYIRRPDAPFELIRGVVTVDGGSQDLVLTDPILAASVPAIGDLVAFGEAEKVVSDWTVKQVQRDVDHTARIRLVPHAPEIHTPYEGELAPYDPVVTVPIAEQRPAAPIVAVIQTGTEVLEIVAGTTRPRVVVTLQEAQGPGAPPIARMIAQFQEVGSDIWSESDVSVEGISRAVYRNVVSGAYLNLRFQVLSVSGRLSDWTEVSNVEVLGLLDPPGTVQNFAVNAIGAQVRLTWDALPDLDLAGYRVRFTPELITPSWVDAIDVTALVAATSIDLPLQVGTYFIKGVDLSGRQSVVAASSFTTVAGIAGLNLVVSAVEHPTFAGFKDDLLVDGALSGLRLASGTDLLVPADLFAFDWAMVDQYASVGTYSFAGWVDLGAVFTSRVTASVKSFVFNAEDDLLRWPDLVDRDWLTAAIGEFSSVVLEVRTTISDPSLNLWGDWQPFIVGDFTAWALQFRLRLTSTEFGVAPVVQELSVTVDMPDRILPFSATIPVGGAVIPFSPAFLAVPVVATNSEDLETGDYAVSSRAADGLTIQFFDTAGTSIERRLTGVAQGYGARLT